MRLLITVSPSVYSLMEKQVVVTKHDKKCSFFLSPCFCSPSRLHFCILSEIGASLVANNTIENKILNPRKSAAGLRAK